MSTIHNSNSQILNLTEISEIIISYHPAIKPKLQPIIDSSISAYKLFLKYWDQDKIEFQEQFNFLLLNRAKGVIGLCQLTTGTNTGTFMDVKQLFGIALKACADCIIIAHNHPSGSLEPSPADISVTKELVNAGRLLSLPILDHLIITNESYLSFADEGLL